MDRKEAEKWIEKFVRVDTRYSRFNGFFVLYKSSDFAYTTCHLRSSLDSALSVLCNIAVNRFRVDEIISIIEIENIFGFIPVHKLFSHEIGALISKRIEQVSVDLNKYPHICKQCRSPAWVNPVTGSTDCSNKGCK